jgi:sec-independent protein translocase protein TatC
MPAKRTITKKKARKPRTVSSIENLPVEIPPEETQEYDPREKVMTLGEHLDELRSVIIKSIVTLVLLMVGSLFFATEIHQFFVKPYKNILGSDATFFQIKLMAPIMIYLKTSFILSLLLSIPIQLSYLWGFVSPAVDEHLEKYGKYLILFSSVLFWSGVAVCWFLVFEGFLSVFLVMFRPPDVDMKLPIDEYYDIFFNIHLVFGLTFQLPVVLILLSAIGILHSDFLLDKWREAVIIISIFSAVLSPGPDVFSMMMLFLPLVFLFFLSIFLMKFMERKNRDTKPEEKEKL